MVPGVRARRVLLLLLLVVTGCTLMVTAGCTLLTQPVRPSQTRGPTVHADAARLQADVVALAHPREYPDTETLDRVARGLGRQLADLGYEPVEQPFEVKGRTFRNVSTVLGDPAAPRVVVGAHYDSCGPLPAADDNASGVAVVLELARLFKQHPPPGAVELVFWSLEEPPVFNTGGMGSVWHAKALRDGGVRVTAALSIETVGYYKDDEDTQHFPVPLIGALYPSRGNFIALVSNLRDTALVRTVKSAMLGTRRIPVYSMNGPELVPGIDWSDHASYWKVGYPALMVTDTAPNRNPAYHEASDTPDTLDYGKMARVTEALFEAIWVLAEQ